MSVQFIIILLQSLDALPPVHWQYPSLHSKLVDPTPPTPISAAIALIALKIKNKARRGINNFVFVLFMMTSPSIHN
jgi:hypothetical protein